MENKTKRFLRLLLVIAMVAAILPMTFALATETDNVAKIGEDEYATLQAAINAVADGQTITLLKDCSDDATLSVSGKNITIDGDGHKYTGKISLSGGNGKNLTIQNATLSPAKNRTVDVATKSNWNVIVDNCNLISTIDKWNYPAVVYGTQTDNLSVTIKNCPKIAGFGYIVAFSQGGKSLTVENCPDITDCVYLVSAGKCNAVTIKSVNYTGESGILMKREGNAKTLTIENVNINVTYSGQLPINISGSSCPIEVDITGSNNLTHSGTAMEGTSWISGNVPLENIDGVENVNADPFAGKVAKIGNVGYATLAEAIAAANAGDTITFLADITENVTVKKNVTIDGAGKTYTGKFTISGDYDVTIQNVNFVKGEIVQNGAKTSATLVVKGCSFTKGGYAITTERIKNLTIENCTVTGQSLLYAKLTTSNITVKNVTVEKGNYVAYLMYGSQATFENVTATNMTGFGICTMNYGAKTITLKNCSFDAPNYYALAVGDDNSTAVDTFIFEGENSMKPLHDSQYAKYVLTEGATLTAPQGYDVTTNVEGHEVAYANGKYSVVEKKTYVAQIGEQGYETLQAAINAATTGDTITFLTDITENVTVNKNVTIDGAGKTYTGTMTMGAVTATIQNAKFVSGEIVKTATPISGNFTIKNCSFEGTTSSGYAIKIGYASQLNIEACTSKNNSFLYVPYSLTNLSVKNVTVDSANWAFHLVSINEPVFENVTVTNSNCGIVVQNTGNKVITLKDCTITAQKPLVIWEKQTNTVTFKLSGANDFGTSDAVWAIVGQSYVQDPGSNYEKLELVDVNATLKAAKNEALNIITNVADHKVAYNNGTYEVVPAAIEVIVTVQNATKVEGNADPQFSYTTNVDVPALDITYTVSGTTINATVAEMDGYEFTVVPGTLTIEKALVRVYAKNHADVKYFASLKEAVEYAVAQKGNVPVYLLSDITINETIMINDTNAGLVELQGDKTGGQTFTLTSTHTGEMFKVEKGTLAVKNLKINSQGDTFYVIGGTLNLNYHSQNKQFLEITSQTGNCIYIRGGDVNVNGAKLTALGEYPAIQGNGAYDGNVTITKWNIGDGTYPVISAPNSDIAIYWPGNGNLTIEGGHISGDTALYVKSGTIVINGGEFYGTGAKVDFAHNSNGANATGDAVVIESCKDAAYETPSVSINGGTFISTNAQGVAVYNCNENKPVTKFISGGIFSSMPAAEWCAEGMGPKYAEDNMWTVGTGIVTVDGVYFDDWNVAKTYIKGSSTIVLYANVENSGSISVGAANKTVTLDLNGYKFTTTTIGVDGHKTLHIIDSATGGSVVVTNYTALYPNGYLNVDSDVDFNSKIQFSYHSEATPSTGCLLIDGQKWIGRGHYQQADGIIGTTGGTVTIKNNFKDITFNSGKFILNATADFADFAGTQNITVNADTTLDLNGNILTTDSIICFSELIDTAQDKTGGIKVSTENISLMQNKTYMPIYDSTNGCFRFYKFNMVSLGVKELNEAGSAVKFGVAIRFDKVEAYGLLADGNNYSYLTLEFVLTLENMDVPTIAYEFAAEQFTTWAANAYTHYNSGKAGDRALVLTVGGLDKLDAGSKLTVAPTLTSEVTKFSVTSVVMEAPAVAPTTTNSTDPTNKDEETENGGNSESGAAGGDDNTGA